MKRTNITQLSLFFACLLLFSCRRDVKDLEAMSKDEDARHYNNRRECRMNYFDYFDPIFDYHNIENITYKYGRVDVWYTSYGYNYTMKYNNHGKLIASTYTDDQGGSGYIDFIYKNGKVVEEKWYDAATNELIDDVNYTYNHRGQMIKGESIPSDYVVKYTYFPSGQLASWFTYLGGLPSQKAEYTYFAPFKNPFRTLNGLDYAFVYVNSGAAIGFGERWYTSEKVTLYDETGVGEVHYEQNPFQTKWEIGDQWLPIFADYKNKDGVTHVLNSFGYENCKSCQVADKSANRTTKGNRGITKQIPSMKKFANATSLPILR